MLSLFWVGNWKRLKKLGSLFSSEVSALRFPCLWPSCFDSGSEEGKVIRPELKRTQPRVITSESDIARTTTSVSSSASSTLTRSPPTRSPRTVFVKKQLSSSSIGSNLSWGSDRSRRSGDSHVSFYQKVLDQISLPWHQKPQPEEMSAFPCNSFIQGRRRLQDVEDVSRKGKGFFVHSFSLRKLWIGAQNLLI